MLIQALSLHCGCAHCAKPANSFVAASNPNSIHSSHTIVSSFPKGVFAEPWFDLSHHENENVCLAHLEDDVELLSPSQVAGLCSSQTMVEQCSLTSSDL